MKAKDKKKLYRWTIQIQIQERKVNKGNNDNVGGSNST